MAYPTYKLFKNIDGVDVCVIKEKNGITMSIPFDADNIDYQQYLEDIILHNISNDEINRLVIKAESGEVRNENDNYLQLILKNGNRYEDVVASTAAEKQIFK